MSKTHLRHYRHIARTVLRWYCEFEEGVIQSEDGPRFDVRVLDYRIDVDSVLRKFHPAEVRAVMAVNRDGFTHAHAVTFAGLATTRRPDLIIEDLEIRMGQAFEQLRLDEFLRYVDYLR